MNSSNLTDPNRGSTTSTLGTGGTTMTSSLAESARETASKVKTAATQTASRAAEQVQTAAARQKEQAAARVEGYSSAIHESAKAFEEQDPNIAWLTHQAADRLHGIATYVRERDFRGLRADAENLARRHPVAFFGGMCVAGLVLGSLIKAAQSSVSSNTNGMSDRESVGYDPDAYNQGQETGSESVSSPAASI